MIRHLTGPTTERLEHRAMTPADAAAFFALNSNPDVMRYTCEPMLQSIEDAREAIVRYPDFDRVGYGRWACVLRSTREMIGFCGLKHLPELDETDVGFRFFPEHWGQGLATEACGACLNFGFETLRLARIIALVRPENGASIRVLEKCGMRPDGDVVYDGVWALRYVASRNPD